MVKSNVNALLGFVLVSALTFLALTTETHANSSVVSAENITIQPTGDYKISSGYAHLKIDNTTTTTHDIKVGSCWQEVTIVADAGYPVSAKGGWLQLDLSPLSGSTPFSFDVCTGDGASTASCTTIDFDASGTLFGKRASTPVIDVTTSCVKPISGYPGYPGYPGSSSGGKGSSLRSYLPILVANQ